MTWRLAGLYVRPDRTCAVRSVRWQLTTLCGTVVPRERDPGGMLVRRGGAESVDCKDCRATREWWEREP